MSATPVQDASLAGAPRGDDSELLLARVRVLVADRYDGLREIGRGGMAVVYAARDRRLNRDIALKVLPPELAYRADVRERFVREAQTAARLNHPNIVPIYAVDEVDGLVYFVMALVQGESLAARLVREPRPPLSFVRTVLAQVADALAYAHRSGVVHRDIKPDNILLEHGTGRAIMTDFGIARAVQSGARLTQTGIAVGTPAFMSPEQAMGQREIDGRSDVYGLGVVGYLMLTGRLPFDADSSAGMLVQHVQGNPFPIVNFRTDLPFSMSDAITRALAREPGQRWPDASAFAAALRAGEADDRADERRRADAVRERAERAQLSPSDPAPPSTLPPAPPSAERAPAHGANDVAHGASHRASENRASDARPYAPAQRERDVAAAMAPYAPRAVDAPWPSAAGSEGAQPPQDSARRIRRFRLHVVRGVLVGLFLLFVNAMTGGFPWFLFPAFGITMGLLGKLMALGEHDIRLRDVIRGRVKGERPSLARPEPTGKPATAAERARRVLRDWKRRGTLLAGSLAASTAGLVGLAASGGNEGFLVPFLGGGAIALLNGALLLRDTLRLRDVGLTVRDAIGERWEDKIAAMDDRPRGVRVEQESSLLANPEVLQSPYGRALREAVDDTTTIRDVWTKLDPADRELVPDVTPTAEALLARVTSLAENLSRLDGAVEAHAIGSLDKRVAELEAMPTRSTDQDRRLSLLVRQRESLAELVARQETLQGQLESASLALRSLRLDVVKLRALGVGAVIGDVTSATQEARAVSADIGRALDVADELRKV